MDKKWAQEEPFHKGESLRYETPLLKKFPDLFPDIKSVEFDYLGLLGIPKRSEVLQNQMTQGDRLFAEVEAMLSQKGLNPQHREALLTLKVELLSGQVALWQKRNAAIT